MKKYLLLCLLLLASTRGFSRGELSFNVGFKANNYTNIVRDKSGFTGGAPYGSLRLAFDVDSLLDIGIGAEIVPINIEKSPIVSPLIPVFGVVNLKHQFDDTKLYIGGALGVGINAGHTTSVSQRTGLIAGVQGGLTAYVMQGMGFNVEGVLRYYASEKGSYRAALKTYYLGCSMGFVIIL